MKKKGEASDWCEHLGRELVSPHAFKKDALFGVWVGARARKSGKYNIFLNLLSFDLNWIFHFFSL